MSCSDCKDTGVIHLLTSTVACKCRTPEAPVGKCPSLERDRQPDPGACFGTINGVTAFAKDATFTLDIDEGTSRGRRFTGLNKEAVDFVHAALNAGWDAQRVAEHLDEMATFRKVNDAQAVRDAESNALNGFTLDEIQDAARTIQAALFKAVVDEDGQEEEIIARELTRLLVRKTIREAITTMSRPGHRFATGGLVKGANINRLSFVPDQTFGTGIPPRGCEFIHHEVKGKDPEIRVVPADLARASSVLRSGGRCGKAAMFRAMYGGKIAEADFSHIEARVMAHFERKSNEIPNDRKIMPPVVTDSRVDFCGFPNLPGCNPNPTDPRTGKTWKETAGEQ